MNDLPLHLNERHIDFFADNATQVTFQNVEENLNTDIQTIVLWNAKNKMVPKKKKEAMIVT